MKNETNLVKPRDGKSPIGWPGGKYLLAPRLIQKFPKYGRIVEPFGGGGNILFSLVPMPGIVEIYNDIDHTVVNFFSVLKSRPDEFIESLRYQLNSREQFNQYKELLKTHEQLTDIERAKIFFVLLKNSFSGMRRDFRISAVNHLYDFSEEAITDVVKRAHKRLARVTIENRDFREVIKIYDRPDTFVYADPPYLVECAKTMYYRYMTESDFFDLYTLFASMKGKFMLSINDCPFIRALFRDFKIEEVPTVYLLHKGKKQNKVELVITNY